MLLPPDGSVNLPSRTRRIIRQVAFVAAVGCLLGLLGIRAGIL